MLSKLLSKASELTQLGRKPAVAPVTPDISRVIRPASVQAAEQPHVPAPAPMAAPAEAPELHADADPEDMFSKAEDAVDALADEFEGWMRDDLEKLREAWAVVRANETSTDAYRALYTCSHNIRGAASSYGFPAVSRLCGSLCTLLGETKPGENSALINLHIDACRAAVATGPQGEGSQSVADQLCDALERKVAEKVAASG
ncbi:MAG: Hpt domain-containing protein [Hyphomonas sp.]